MYFCIGNTRRLYPRRALREIYMVHPPLSIKIVKNSDEIYCKEGEIIRKRIQTVSYTHLKAEPLKTFLYENAIQGLEL